MKTISQLKITDEQLIQDYLMGDSNAWGDLYTKYFNKVYYKCLSYVHDSDNAFDMAQDVLLKALGSLPGFKGQSKFSTWLFSITQNYCISYCMKSKRFQNNSMDNNFDVIDDACDNEEIEERSYKENKELQLVEYLNQIPETDKYMLELKYRNNYSVKQLQDEFNLSKSAVKMRLLRARSKVEKIYCTN